MFLFFRFLFNAIYLKKFIQRSLFLKMMINRIFVKRIKMESKEDQPEVKRQLINRINSISQRLMLGPIRHVNVMADPYTTEAAKRSREDNLYVNDTTGHITFEDNVSNEFFLNFVSDEELKLNRRTMDVRICDKSGYTKMKEDQVCPPVLINDVQLSNIFINEAELVSIKGNDIILAKFVDNLLLKSLYESTKTTFDHCRKVFNPIIKKNYMHYSVEDGRWYRNKIIEILKTNCSKITRNPRNVRVELIDFKTEKIIEMWQLRELPEEYRFPTSFFYFKTNSRKESRDELFDGDKDEIKLKLWFCKMDHI